MASLRCKRCSHSIPLEWERCPHCARPGLFANVEQAKLPEERKALGKRYRAALRRAGKRGCEDLVHRFQDAVKDSRAVLNRPLLEAVALLRSEVAKEQALQIALILLDGTDGGYPPPIRSSAAKELESSLADVRLEEYLSRVLFAHPLSQDGDLDGAFAYVPVTLLHLRNLLEDLCLYQAYIAIVCRAWEAIPMAIFGSLRERALAKAQIVQNGGFRDLVRAKAAGGTIDPSLAQHWPPDLRGLFDAWVSALRLDLGRDAQRPASLDSAAGLGSVEEGTTGFVAENVATETARHDWNREISKAYNEFWGSRTQADGQPGSAGVLSRSFESLRVLQNRQADAMERFASSLLPGADWTVLRSAEKFLGIGR